MLLSETNAIGVTLLSKLLPMMARRLIEMHCVNTKNLDIGHEVGRWTIDVLSVFLDIIVSVSVGSLSENYLVSIISF